MPCPHFEMNIVQRSEGQSAVAAAAYQSGKKLYSEYDQATKHYPEKEGIVFSEILLPPNAPPEYADQNTLWNAVEKVEKQWNSQLARRFRICLPREVPEEQYTQLLRDYFQEFFVSKGMCVDYSIHDPYPPGHNPHVHFLLTMRAMDENGKWLPKSRKVYDLDENGERIRLPSGYWKSHKELTVDWSEQSYAEVWRQGWADWQNRYLERNNRPERVDLRSYERQGIDKIPTVHMGPAATAMERRGIQTDVGNLNREIGKMNRLMQSIRQFIHDLMDTIAELRQEERELKAQRAAEVDSSLPSLLMKYMDIRKEERKDWTPYGRRKATAGDLKKVSEAIVYLDRLGLHSVDDLEAHIEKSYQESKAMNAAVLKKQKRIKEIDRIFASLDNMKQFQPFYEKYAAIKWKKAKEKYKQENPEVEKFLKTKRFLDKQMTDGKIDRAALRAERETLVAEMMEASKPMEVMEADLKQLRDIRYWVRKATPGTDESKEAPPKQSVLERISEPAPAPKPDPAKSQEQNKENMER